MSGLEGTSLGNCRILRRLGGSGMSDVYLAEQTALGRQVAVKVLRADFSHASAASAEQIDQQSRQEVQIIAALDHPHILPIYDYGEQDSLHYLIMAYVRTGSLADILSPGPMHRLTLPVRPALVADLVAQTAEALQHAHDRGIIHRDVKPGNLLVRLLRPGQAPDSATMASGEGYTPGQYYVLLADFGLARFLTSVAEGTSTAGTPLYSAPEQYLGHPDPASDQYALACVAYLLLSGQAVFEGNIAELYHQHLSVSPKPVTLVNPGLPPAVDKVLLRALSKGPAGRFPEIVDFSSALSGALKTGLPPPSLVWPATQAWQGTTPTQPSTWTLRRAPSEPVLPLDVDGVESSFAGERWDRRAESDSGFGDAPTLRTSGRDTNPDAPGAPLPRQFRAEQRWIRVPLKRRSLVVGLAAILVLTVLTGVGVNVWQRFFSPTAGDQHVAHVARSGEIDAGQLTPLGTGQSAQAESTQPVLQIGTNTETDHISGLPALSPSGSVPPPQASLGDPNAFAGIKQTIPGVGQNDAGLAAPVDVSVAASAGYLTELVDGVVQIEDFGAASNGGRFSAAALFAPVLRDGDVLGEGRVFADVASRRWLIVINETAMSGAGVSLGYFDVAVSQGASPLSRWQIYQFSTNMAPLPGFGRCTWADYPQVGADASAFYISGNSFECGANGPFLGAVIWELPRLALSGTTATTLYRFWGFVDQQRRPVMTLTPAVANQGETTAWFLSTEAGYVDGGRQSKQLMIWALIHTNGSSAQDGVAVAGSSAALPYPYADPPSGVQGGSSSRVLSGDARVTGAFVAAGHLYATFTTAVNWRGDTQTRSAVYWLDIVPGIVGSGGTPSLSARVSQANIFGFEATYLYSPALAVTSAGDLALLAEASSPVLAPDLLLTGRLHTDPPGTMGQGRESGFLESTEQVAAVSGDWSGYGSASIAMASSGGQTTSSIWIAGSYVDPYSSQWQTVLAELNGAGG
jgi:serine/threonine protein kinase